MRDIIKLVSTANTGHFYTTTKNKRKKPEKMEVKKYDPKVKKHVVYKEGKIQIIRLGRIISNVSFLFKSFVNYFL